MSISSKNNDHLQRNANNCWSSKLCVSMGDANAIEARKMDDKDIQKLAAAHEGENLFSSPISSDSHIFYHLYGRMSHQARFASFQYVRRFLSKYYN